MIGWLRNQMRTSDWAFYGILYGTCLAAITVTGAVGIGYFGISDDAEKNRSRLRRDKKSLSP